MATTAIYQPRYHGSFNKNQVNEANQASLTFTSTNTVRGNDADNGSLQPDTQQPLQSPRVNNRKRSIESCNQVEGKEESGNGKSPAPAPTKGISRAVLARKYLVYFEDSSLTECQSDSGDNRISSNNSANTPPQLRPTKVPLKCLKVATKEWMQCKITQRDDKGVSTLAAHERVGDCSEFINPISELIVTPKYFCMISPATYGNLHSYIYSKGTLKESETRHLFEQMVSIVKFCHSSGIILRDLKLGKFVFTDKERTTIKLDSLEDVAVLPNPDSEDDSLDDRHGCPNYVSPEKTDSVMKSGTKYPGKASDVWSLGVSLYTMLAGRYPFNDSDCSRLLHKIRSGNYNMIEGISPFVKSLVRCLLTKSPHDRPSCRELLNHPWFRTNDLQIAPSPVRSREELERELCRAKKMKMNDDQVVPGSS